MPFFPGETAPAGAPIVTVMDVSRVIARAHLSQIDAAEIAVGNDASLIGPSGVPIAAKVTHVSPALDAANTTVEVWIEADNKDGKLRPGASVRVEMVAKTGAERAGHSADGGHDKPYWRDLRHADRQR